MTIEAYREGKPLPEALVKGAEVAVAVLEELAAPPFLQVARRAVAEIASADDAPFPEVLRRMIKAVRMLGEPDFTPMAAVAGTIADLVKEAVCAAGADHAVVNNGGDISLFRREEDPPLRVGIVRDLAEGRVTHVIHILPGRGIGGLATSGLGGRSLTKGVASAVTVLAADSSLADAAATAVANATNCDDPAVERCRAEEIDYFTDIRGHLVTRRVGRLGEAAVEEALTRGLERFLQLRARGMPLRGAVLFVQGRMKMWPQNIVRPLTEASLFLP